MILEIMGYKILHPQAFFVLIPLVLVLLFFIIKKSVAIEDNQRTARKVRRIIFLVTRLLVFIALVIALSSPFKEDLVVTSGDPKITVLIDNSSSFSMFDVQKAHNLAEDLRKIVPTDVVIIGDALHSNIGDVVLHNLKPNENLLVITDGQITRGSSLYEAADVAANVNATICLLDMGPVQKDISVYVNGPSKVLLDVENNFDVHLSKVDMSQYHLIVSIDDKTIIDTIDTKDIISFTYTFSREGHHKIAAKITNADYFEQNNIFYKTVHVVEKPKILVVSSQAQRSPLVELLEQLYEVTVAGNIPEDLSNYHLIILKDMDGDSLGNVDKLIDFVNDGNGIVSVGGFNSFDQGSYKNSMLERILPVTIGTGEQIEGNMNVVVVLDMSGSARALMPGTDISVASFSKALALNIIENIDHTQKVGVIVFYEEAFVVSQISLLKNKIKFLREIIPRISERFTLSTGTEYGLKLAYDIISRRVGTKHVILISDGGEDNRAEIYAMASGALSKGIKTYSIRVPTSRRKRGSKKAISFLKRLAEVGHGIYLEADQRNKLKLIFGDPIDMQTDGSKSLEILNENHFITEGLNLTASLSAFNNVVPKSSARVLVSLSSGQPAVTIWRLGLGRVAAITAFTKTGLLGPVLNKENSQLISRIMNWGIGDPERNKDFYINVRDSYFGEPIILEVKSSKVPTSEGLSFIKTDKNLYKTKLEPKHIGFNLIMDYPFAVNYAREYKYLGMNDGLEEASIMTGGLKFKPDEVGKLVKFLETNSQRMERSKIFFRWPFIIFAMILFLAEVCLRRVVQNWFN